MTDEKAFLKWCEEKGLKPSLVVKPNGHRRYKLTIKKIVLTGEVEMSINPEQDSDVLDVYFNSEGRWRGGTNMIWNTGLPWESEANRS